MSTVFDFSKRPKDMIKHERLKKSHSHEMMPIPDPIPNKEVSIRQFRRMERTQESKKAPDSFEIRKVILLLLKDRPDLWKNLRKVNEDEWRELGMDLYQRTGEIVSVTQLIDTFRRAKNNLTHRMGRCAKEGLGVVDSENVLSQWEFFPYIRFYYEFRLMNWHFEDEDDDEIHFLGFHAPENRAESLANTEYVHVVQNDPQYGNLQTIPPIDTYLDNHITPLDSISRQGYYDAPERETSLPRRTPTPSRKRHLDFSTETDVEQISYQLHRVFAQYPEKENLIRKAMFSTILEFDNGNIHDLGQMFSSLAAKHSTPENKF